MQIWKFRSWKGTSSFLYFIYGTNSYYFGHNSSVHTHTHIRIIPDGIDTIRSLNAWRNEELEKLGKAAKIDLTARSEKLESDRKLGRSRRREREEGRNGAWTRRANVERANTRGSLAFAFRLHTQSGSDTKNREYHDSALTLDSTIMHFLDLSPFFFFFFFPFFGWREIRRQSLACINRERESLAPNSLRKRFQQIDANNSKVEMFELFETIFAEFFY